jgi:hypothetical protein
VHVAPGLRGIALDLDPVVRHEVHDAAERLERDLVPGHDGAEPAQRRFVLDVAAHRREVRDGVLGEDASEQIPVPGIDRECVAVQQLVDLDPIRRFAQRVLAHRGFLS